MTTQRRIKKLVSTFCSDLDIKLVFTLFKIKSWFGTKVPIPTGLDRFYIQARVIIDFSRAGCSQAVILVKPIDTSRLASVNISPPTNIPTSLST